MSISRWEPWTDVVTLRDAMDQFMHETFSRPRMGMGMDIGVPIDVMELNDTFIVEAVLPGVKPEDVQLQVKDDKLMISGDIKEEQQQQKQGQWLMRERRFGHYQRSVTLPSTIDADKVNAVFQNGLLRVTLPKSHESRARSIEIKAS